MHYMTKAKSTLKQIVRDWSVEGYLHILYGISTYLLILMVQTAIMEVYHSRARIKLELMKYLHLHIRMHNVNIFFA